MPLQAGSDLDLVTTTLRWLGPPKWTDLISSLQVYVAVEELMNKHKVGFTSGYEVQFNVQVATGGQAKMTGLFPIDSVNIVDGQLTGTYPIRHTTMGWGIERREIAMNREPYRIVELIKARRAQGFVDLVELMETQFWSLPGGSSDSSNVFGAPYWIVPNATAAGAVGGFNGLNPFGYTAGAANIDSTKYPNWANYTDSYAFVTRSDLLRKMRRAYVFCDWRSPKLAAIPQYSNKIRMGWYTTYAVLGLIEEALEQANDNLGSDIAPYDGEAQFRKVPIVRVPKLEVLSGQGMSGTFSNSTYTSTGGQAVNPVYGIDWSRFRPVFLEGEYMRHSGPFALPPMHTTLLNFVDLSWAIECRDRRHQIILTQ